jgi:hypothetical protein
MTVEMRRVRPKVRESNPFCIIVPFEWIQENSSTGNDLPGMMQILRELYQNLQLFAKWRVYENPAFCGKADETVSGIIKRFSK